MAVLKKSPVQLPLFNNTATNTFEEKINNLVGLSDILLQGHEIQRTDPPTI